MIIGRDRCGYKVVCDKCKIVTFYDTFWMCCRNYTTCNVCSCKSFHNWSLILESESSGDFSELDSTFGGVTSL